MSEKRQTWTYPAFVIGSVRYEFGFATVARKLARPFAGVDPPRACSATVQLLINFRARALATISWRGQACLYNGLVVGQRASVNGTAM